MREISAWSLVLLTFSILLARDVSAFTSTIESREKYLPHNHRHFHNGPSSCQSHSPLLKPSLKQRYLCGNRQHSTQCQLFFRAREEQALSQKRQAAQAKIPAWALESLSQPNTPLPFQFALQDADNNLNNDTPNQVVTIRLLEVDDLPIIVPMCTTEFGATNGEDSWEYLQQNIPWQNPLQATKFLQEWFEQAALPSFIYWTFRVKISSQRKNPPQDHALLVATIQQQQKEEGDDDETIIHDDKPTLATPAGTVAACSNEKLVGMVELSKQPPDPKRNPKAYPLPIWYKQAYCIINGIPPINGWVTNLLVGPDYRSQGYSKLLMAAAEGVARTWDCTRIHLHCDADTVSGKIPQSLYQALGYEMVEDPNSPFAWMGTEFSNKIFMIQGVALLYMRKELG